jgi:hypothetical protein
MQHKFSCTLNMETEGTYLENDTMLHLKMERCVRRIAKIGGLLRYICLCVSCLTIRLPPGPSPDGFS